MKICLVVNNFPSYSETFITNKVMGLAKKGHEITVVRTNNFVPEDIFKVYDFASYPIKIVDCIIPTSPSSLFKQVIKQPVLFFKSFSFNFNEFKRNYLKHLYKNIFESINADIVHFEFSGLAVNFLPAFEYIQAKKVVSCRGSAENVKLLSDKVRQLAIVDVFNKVNAIHCVSNTIKETILPYCSQADKIFINHPSIDTDFFYPSTNAKTNVVMQILSVGRMTFQKGYIFGMLAMKELLNNGIQFKWTIVGDGPLKDEMLFHIHELGLTEQVILAGAKNRNEINQLLDTSDIFLLTSVTEGLPNVILEAMSKELPVVATKAGGVVEVIEDGVDGLLAELYDVKQIAQQIQSLIQNTPLQKQLGKAARTKIINQFNIHKQMDVFQNQYQLIQANK